MDWADDITYAIHDMSDFYCAGLIPLHILVAGAERWNANDSPDQNDINRQELKRFFDSTFLRFPSANRQMDEKALIDALQYCTLKTPYEGGLNQTRELWTYCSILIGKYVDGIVLVDPSTSSDGRSVQINEAAVRQTTMLKQLTWHYVIEHSDLATIQYGQRKMIRELFEVFFGAIEKKKLKLFPIGFEELILSSPSVPSARWTADYISGLTEREVLRLHHRLMNPS